MRPELIEIEGFGAFKEPATVDFTDVDLFGFTGPTGAGKSTLIDAMVFALYGSVPRYDDNRLVAPAISQGRAEAKVHLRFTVDDKTYTAVRVVRRTKTGASTKEARLELGDEVIAGDVKELDAAVESLLGLNLDQFTTCVVLPQGQFATLLHATPKDRQDLLVRLLDLGRYRQMGSRARARAAEASTIVERIETELDDLTGATDESLAEATALVESAGVLTAIVEQLVPAIADVDRRRAGIDGRLVEIERARRVMTDLSAPPEAAQIAAEVRAAAADASDARVVADDAATLATRCEADLAALGDADLLKAHHGAHLRRAHLLERIEKGRSMVGEAEAAVERAASAADAAAAAAVAADAHLDEIRRALAVADAAGHLGPGDDCPVCGSVIVTVVDHDRDELDQASARCDATNATLAEADQARSGAQTEVARLAAKLEERRDELAVAEAQLVGAADIDRLVAQLADIEAAVASLGDARSVERSARSRLGAAIDRAERARAAEQSARHAFGDARDRVARSAVDGHAPPAPGDDLAFDWSALLEWCAEQAARAGDEAADLVAQGADLADEAAALHRQLDDAFESLGLDRPPADRAMRAAGEFANDSNQRLARLAERIERRTTLTADLDHQRETVAVHRMLGSLLSTSGFEQWLLGEALDALVEGASAWLGELSSGAYALAVDDDGREFVVIDRRDADQRRLAKTLSGGETFLASLALALALAERISELAAEGAPKLESIFLDEGFGTLDPQTLDVVASAIEELGATGRMVGVISHVTELAERLPTVYEVSKTAETAAVERVDR